MKQIRTGVFETNSSSTHSFTIKKQDDLVENGRLHYENLYKLSAAVDAGWIMQCKTYEEKFSMIIHAVMDAYISEQNKNELFQLLKEQCKYEIIYTEIKESFGMYDEDEGYFFEEDMSLKGCIEVLEDLILKAEDDSIMFRESNIEW